MPLISDSTSLALERALDLRFERQNLLTGNVANVSTPNYQPVDMEFEGALRSAAEEGDAQPPGFARTDAGHLPGVVDPMPTEASLVVRSDVTNSLDGNGVDLDREMARIADNKVRFDLTAEAARRRISELVNVIAQMGTI
ncbi:MAG: flagellar basal body rod protein FlgB [Myxococcota bacterium]